jgi:phage-related protein
MTMSVTITDEQYQEITRYLTALRSGDGFEIMNDQPLNNKLAEFMATLPGGTPPSRENDEEIIRRNLLIWSPPSCP